MIAHLRIQCARFKDVPTDGLGTTHWHLHDNVVLLPLAVSALAFQRGWPSWWLLTPVLASKALNEPSEVTLLYRTGEGRN